MLTETESGELIRLLDKMERPYPQDLFFAICRNTIACPVDIAALTCDGKVLLFRRPASDPFFAGLWALPGTVQLPGDSIEDALDRLLHKEELTGVSHTSPAFVFNGSAKYGVGPNESHRGQEESRVHMVWVNENDYSGEGRFFPLNKIPEDTYGPHRAKYLPELWKRFCLGALPR